MSNHNIKAASMGKCRKSLLNICLIAGAIITFLTTLFGREYSYVYAAPEPIMSIKQEYAYNSAVIGAKSGEEIVRDLYLIDGLNLEIANSEHHWFCSTCGCLRAFSKVTVKVSGCTNNSGEETLLKTYTVMGGDVDLPKKVSETFVITDTIRQTYDYLKLSVNMSVCAAHACEHAGGNYYSTGLGYVNVYGQNPAGPVIREGGDITDKTFIEDCPDYIGVINAYFPGDEKYQWQYSEDTFSDNAVPGNDNAGDVSLGDENTGDVSLGDKTADESWVDITDGSGSYATRGHGILKLTDKNGGTEFSKSNMLMLNNPEVRMSGLRFRVILKGESEDDNTISSIGVITVMPKDITEFYSVRLAGRYGQVGSLLSLEDIIAYVKFNNRNVVELTEEVLKDSRIKYYGFVNVNNNDISGLDEKEVIERLNNGTITATEIPSNSQLLKIKQGRNVQYIKLTYEGSNARSVYEAVIFNGVDEIPPQFDENVELYEADGVTLYTDGNYKISDRDETRKLRIRGYITDTVNDSEDISWAYTLTGTKDPKKEVTIPVYRMGSEIDVKVEINGTYTLFAGDTSGNTAQKIINVKAFDENSPEMEVKVSGITSENSSDAKYYSAYMIDVEASDKEGMPRKAYLYRRYNELNDAQEFVRDYLSDDSQTGKDTDMIKLLEDEFASDSSKTVSVSGYYVVAVRDAVNKTVSDIIKLPQAGEILDAEKPEIVLSPTPVKDASGDLSEYDIVFADNQELNGYYIKDSLGNAVVSIRHNHKTECKGGACAVSYHFAPDAEGSYTVTAYDKAGNAASSVINVKERSIESFEIIGLSQTMSVDAIINTSSLIADRKVLIKLSDGTTQLMTNQSGMKLKIECENEGEGGNTDSDNNETSDSKGSESVTIAYGTNALKFLLTINAGIAKEKTYEYRISVTGEDNVAPVAGTIEASYSEGWQGELTNDSAKTVTLKAAGYADDCTSSDKLLITWYLNDTELCCGKVSDGGDTYGPFSGEEYNGTYRYSVTDENGNTATSQSGKIIDAWDITPPTGSVRLLPDGVTEDSKARYKQIQIVDASDNRSLNAKPYSFMGDAEECYGIVNSVVAGDNATYEICLRDAANNVTSLGTYSLTGIDSIPPVIEGYDIEKTEDGQTILHISATDTDASGEDKSSSLSYSIDGQTYVDSPDFPIEESGSYTIYVKDDTGNITKTSTDYTDTDNPEITASQGDNQSGTIIISVTDNVGLSRVTMEGPDGIREILQVYDGATSDTVTKEIGKTGKYTITVMDMSGNTASAEVDIEYIAPVCSSSVLSGLRNANSEWTNGDVTVIAELLDTNGLSSAPFKWNGSIPNAHPYIIVSENGPVSIEIVDQYGNVIANDSMEVTNIDKLPPAITYLKQSEDKNSLLIKASDTISGIKAVTISGGPYTVESCAVVLDNAKEPDEIAVSLPEDGSYTIRVYDAAGNCSQKQLSADGVTTGQENVVTKEVVKEVVRQVEVPVETVVAQDRIVNQTVEVPKVITVPVPTIEKVTEYKTIRESGGDTSEIIREQIGIENKDNDGDNSNNIEEKVESESHENEISNQQKTEEAIAGYLTADGTYMAPDGYEYFSRVPSDLKQKQPFKYFFKKNAEKIAVFACVMCILLLILCLIMGYILLRDYMADEDNRKMIKRFGRKE